VEVIFILLLEIKNGLFKASIPANWLTKKAAVVIDMTPQLYYLAILRFPFIRKLSCSGIQVASGVVS
jgi:hypothetical protein